METTLPAPAATAMADPTKVSGRRLGAYIIDSVILMAVVPVAIFFAVSQPTIYTDSPGCTFLEVRSLVPSGQTCFEVTGNGDLAGTWVMPTTGYVAAGIYLVIFLIGIEWLLQAATGMTIGKLLFGIRTVNASGSGPGIGKQLIRGVLWIIDGITLCLPIAAWAIIITKRNQRIGDLAAGTFVIRSTSRGAPVPGAPVPAAATPPPIVPGPPAATPTTGYAPPPPSSGYPAAPPEAAPPVAAPAAAAAFATPPPPSDPTTLHTPADEPTIIQPAVSGPSDGDATVAEGWGPSPEPAAADVPVEPVVKEPAAAATATAADGGPQWDPARNAYIQWDPNQATWLVYDDAAAQWKPIS